MGKERRGKRERKERTNGEIGSIAWDGVGVVGLGVGSLESHLDLILAAREFIGGGCGGALSGEEKETGGNEGCELHLDCYKKIGLRKKISRD